MKYRILVVDDLDVNLNATQLLLEKWGYDVETATSGDEAISKIMKADEEYAVILLDYKMPGKNGDQVAREIRALNEETIILIFSADDSREAILDSWAAGAIAFVDKDVPDDELQRIVESNCRKFEETSRTLKIKTLNATNEKLIGSIGMVGQSTAMAEVAIKVMKYRLSSEPVLITGETGVGKEMIARALHTGDSDRFRAINCAAFSENSQLLESELFGYEKGSFTGASSMGKVGILESARGGVVFFDELHRLSVEAQGKLLRAFQEKKIRRVGGTSEYEVDFRIVSGANSIIETMVEDGQFLPDLYERLNVLQIHIPPLHERREDIAPLIAHFTQKYCERTAQKKTFLMKTVRYLENYPWRSNVRELGNTVTRLLTNSNGKTIDPKQLDSKFFSGCDVAIGAATFAELERRHDAEKKLFLSSALDTARSASQAASRLGLPSSTMYDLMDKYGIKKTKSDERQEVK